MKKNLLLVLLFLGIDVIFYWNLWNTYFQQDEWFLFGRAIYESQHLPIAFFDFAAKHFWPLGNILWFLLYKTVAFNASFFAIVALLLQSFASLTLYYLLNGMIKNKVAVWILVLLFVVSFPSRQVIVWFAVSPFLIPCLIGILLFSWYLQKCVKKGSIGMKENTILFLFFLLAFGFREESMMLFLLTPVYIYLFSKKEDRWQQIKNSWPLLSIVITTIILRFLFDHIYGEKVVFDADNPLKIISYNIISIPPKLVVQNIFELEDIWPFAIIYTKLGFPWLVPNGITIINTVFEDIVFLFMIPLTYFLGYAYANMNEYKKKVFIFSLAWLALCTILLAAGGRRLQFLESRYLYVASIGVLLLFYTVFSTLWNLKGGIRYLFRVFTIICLLLITVYSYIGIQSRIESIYLPLSKQRQDIIYQILSTYPSIPKQAIFYATCKDPADCKANKLVLPFQSGVGQMLMVLYGSKNESAYAPFFKDYYLWDWEAQGYQEINGYGFGYFREYDKLKQGILKGQFLPEDVFAFTYDKKLNKITDISHTVRNELYAITLPSQ